MAILSRAIEPSNGNWTVEAATSIVGIGLSAADHERLNELAGSAREGTLTAGEEAELDNYRHVGRLLELMKAKARLSLKLAAGRSKATDGC